MMAKSLKRYYICIVLCGAIILLLGIFHYSKSSFLTPLLLDNSTLVSLHNRTEDLLKNSQNRTAVNTGVIATNSNEVAKSVGYLLVVRYSSQMSAGFREFYHLASITALLNLSTVEPYIQDIGLHGAPSTVKGKPNPKVVKISSFYDLKNLKMALRTCTNSSLVTLRDFARNASRNVILVSFLTSLGSLGDYFSSGNQSLKIVKIEKMTSSQQRGLKTLNSWVSYVREKEGLQLPSSSFTRSRVILVDARPLHPLPMADLMTKLHSVIHQEIEIFGSTTIVLDEWRGVQQKYLSGFYYFIKGFQYKYCRVIDTVKHSSTVNNAVEKFKKSLKEYHPIASVHIRAERLVIDFHGNKSHLTDCLSQLKQLLKNGTVANNSCGNVHIFHDLGQHGSRSCNMKSWHECGKNGKIFLDEIKRDFNNTIVSFNPLAFRPVSLQAMFASFVEKEFMSGVDVLVTVGRGGYQESIVKRFLKNHGWKTDNLYRICHNPQVVSQNAEIISYLTLFNSIFLY